MTNELAPSSYLYPTGAWRANRTTSSARQRPFLLKFQKCLYSRWSRSIPPVRRNPPVINTHPPLASTNVRISATRQHRPFTLQVDFFAPAFVSTFHSTQSTFAVLQTYLGHSSCFECGLSICFAFGHNASATQAAVTLSPIARKWIVLSVTS